MSHGNDNRENRRKRENSNYRPNKKAKGIERKKRRNSAKNKFKR